MTPVINNQSKQDNSIAKQNDPGIKTTTTQVLDNTNNTESNEDAFADARLRSGNPVEASHNPNLTNKTPVVIVTNPDTEPSPIYAAVTETDEDDGRKNKLRGFFRKVTRTFEKRTNIDPTDNDDRLLVGGLAIKL